MRKLKRQTKYETLLKAELTSANVKLVTISKGFQGANLSSMLTKKAQRLCEKRHRFRACKKCTGCRTSNCGLCTNCSDMPAFGGMGINKQKCMKRVCVNPGMQSCVKCSWNTDAL